MAMRGWTVAVVLAGVVAACSGEDVATFDGASKPVQDGGTGGTGGSSGASGAGGTAAGDTGGSGGEVGGTGGVSGTGGGGTGGVGGTGGSGGSQQGEPCTDEGARTCPAPAQQTYLECVGGFWVSGECPGDDICDTRPGPTYGQCSTPVAVCVGHAPGDVVCEGEVLHVCGPELLTSETITCLSATHCQVGTSGQCAVCLPGEYKCDGALLLQCAATHLEFELVADCVEPAYCNAAQQKCASCTSSYSTATSGNAVDMYIMADRSGSMATGSLWTNLVSALTQYFDNPAHGGVAVALRFFPLNDSCEPLDPACSGAGYVTPLVPWDVLPAHASILISTTNATQPDGCHTPTQEALSGVLEGVKARRIAVPSRNAVAVLLSDGEPCCGDCPVEDAAGLAAIAASYFGAVPSVQTHTVSLASAANSVMSAIADAGGGDTFITGGQSSAVLDALEQISRGTACELAVPPVPGVPVDPTMLYVTLTPPSGSGTLLPRVANALACTGAGWFLDTTSGVPMVALCPDSCAAYRATAGSELQVRRDVCD